MASWCSAEAAAAAAAAVGRKMCRHRHRRRCRWSSSGSGAPINAAGDEADWCELLWVHCISMGFEHKAVRHATTQIRGMAAIAAAL